MQEGNFNQFILEQLHQASDKFFKAMFSVPNNLRHYLEPFVDKRFLKQLRFNQMQLHDTRLVNRLGRRIESDLCVSIPILGYRLPLIVLFEHQSTPDRLMPLRVLEYSCEILRSLGVQFAKQKKRQGNHFKLPFLIPTVFYTGKRTYPYSTQLSSMTSRHKIEDGLGVEVAFKLQELKKMLSSLTPDKSSYCLGLQLFDQAKKANEEEMIGFLLRLKEKYFSGEEEFARMGVLYLLSQNQTNLRSSFLEEVVVMFNPVFGGKEMATIAEQLMRKGYDKGVNQGITRGITQGITQGIGQGITQGIGQGITQGIGQGVKQARQLWLQSNDAILQAMRDRGLSKDSIDLFANMSQESVEELTEH